MFKLRGLVGNMSGGRAVIQCLQKHFTKKPGVQVTVDAREDREVPISVLERCGREESQLRVKRAC